MDIEKMIGRRVRMIVEEAIDLRKHNFAGFYNENEYAQMQRYLFEREERIKHGAEAVPT